MYRETESFKKKSHAAFSDTYSLNSYLGFSAVCAPFVPIHSPTTQLMWRKTQPLSDK